MRHYHALRDIIPFIRKEISLKYLQQDIWRLSRRYDMEEEIRNGGHGKGYILFLLLEWRKAHIRSFLSILRISNINFKLIIIFIDFLSD